MSKLLLTFLFAMATGLLGLTVGSSVYAQDCQRVVSGNDQSPCKQLDYLNGLQPPTFSIAQFTDNEDEYYCQGLLEWQSESPLNKHKSMKIKFAESRTLSHTEFRHPDYHGPFGFAWPTTVTSELVEINDNLLRIYATERAYLDTPVREVAHLEGYYPSHLWPYFQFTADMDGYVLISEVFDSPREVADYQTLMNQCLAGISRQLEHEAAEEAARQQAEADRIAAETAAQEAENQAEIATIELQSAQDALKAQEALNAALLAETILAIKREDALRAAWQQVMLVRMAGLEERTNLWNEAMERWTTEDLQFSTAMQARIQEVERLQALSVALEQSMAHQRRLLIAQLEELEQAEKAAQEVRNADASPASDSLPGG